MNNFKTYESDWQQVNKHGDIAEVHYPPTDHQEALNDKFVKIKEDIEN